MSRYRRLHPIFLLTFFFLETRTTSAQLLFSGKCPDLHSMVNFKPDFFLGRWYEIERYFVSYEGLAGTCWVENYLFQKGRGHFTRLDWKDHLTGSIRSIENGITFNNHKPSILKYVVQKPNVPILQGEYMIMATDYDTFALAWQCDELPLAVGHTEILWFLSKNQYPSKSTRRKVKKLALSLGLYPEYLQSQDRTHCPH